MSEAVEIGTGIAIALLGLACLLCGFRLLRGPSAADRILALDALYINAIALLLNAGIRYAERTYFEAALLIALLGFIGTIALARHRSRAGSAP